MSPVYLLRNNVTGHAWRPATDDEVLASQHSQDDGKGGILTIGGIPYYLSVTDVEPLSVGPTEGGVFDYHDGRYDEHWYDPQLTTADVAAILNVTPATVRSYAARGILPAPDGHLGRTPWWSPERVEAWQAARPGQGAGGGRKAAGHADSDPR